MRSCAEIPLQFPRADARLSIPDKVRRIINDSQVYFKRLYS